MGQREGGGASGVDRRGDASQSSPTVGANWRNQAYLGFVTPRAAEQDLLDGVRPESDDDPLAADGSIPQTGSRAFSRMRSSTSITAVMPSRTEMGSQTWSYIVKPHAPFSVSEPICAIAHWKWPANT